jgi:hypothetical protein
VHAADATIVVVQASPKDIEAQGAAEGLIEKAGKQDRTLYVINRVDRTSTLTKSAIATLRGKGVREPVLIGDRVEYVRADAAGKAANETSEKARVELAALWTAVKGVIGK